MELSVSELRIGSWVNYKGHIVKWDYSDFGEVERSHIMDFVNPINLTDQWLKDFGYEEFYNGWTGWWQNTEGNYVVFDKNDHPTNLRWYDEEPMITVQSKDVTLL